MKRINDIIVTTTSDLSGITVLEYLKPISAHIVAGTDFFSDFFASFSDIFGGRSQTYQKQLSSIYEEAISSLKRNAYEIGANAILGLKVDIDEISGKNKSMFMITALGTAAIIDIPEKQIAPEENSGIVSLDKVEELRKRKKIIQLAKENKLVLNDDTWTFLINNKVFEASEEILSCVQSDYNLNITTKHNKYLTAYLLSIDEQLSTHLLYKSYLNTEEPNVSFSKFVYNLIKDLSFTDLNMITEYLKVEDLSIRKKLLHLLMVDKQYYSEEDCSKYIEIIDTLKQAFPENTEIIIQKGKFSSKEKEMWRCKCGTLNSITDDRCKCGSDKEGFSSWDVTAKTVIEHLNENVELIRQELEIK